MTSPPGKYVLFHAEGVSSTAIELAFKVLLQPNEYEIVELDWMATTHEKSNAEDANVKRMKAANPLMQFPTVIAPDGSVLTELVAIFLYLLDQHGANSSWGPALLHPAQRAAFFRWMLVVSNQFYPTLPILDFPERYITVPADAPVSQEEGQKWVKDTVSQRRKDAFLLLENEFFAKTPRASERQFALGTEKPTFLDVYLALIVHYAPHPRPTWIIENCPQLIASVRETVKVPEVHEVFKRNDLDDFF
ncbi:Glutathione S-transferase [Mycena kentingensis (nom. inval.)]|nr:Glutathione S-transferase [Mycena kentingensis (nom. inval.)]